MTYTENELRLADRIIAEWKASCEPQPLYRRGPVRSILRSEIPPWALKLAIVAAIVLRLT